MEFWSLEEEQLQEQEQERNKKFEWDVWKGYSKRFDIKTRTFWGAQQEKWSSRMKLPITCVFNTFTLTDPCFRMKSCIREIQYLQRYYMRNGTCPDIRYSFLIGGDGTVYEGRGWGKKPGLPPEYRRFNTNSIFIGLIGNFNDKPPYDAMFESREKLIKYGVENEFIAQKFLMFQIKPARVPMMRN